MLEKIAKNKVLDLALRVTLTLILLYLFLIGVKCLSASFKLMGGGFASTLLNISSNPFSSLMAGMLATVLFQSSSVTTSIIVGLVSSSSLSIGGAVPMIMGANLGTSVTNSLVSLGYAKNAQHFKRAFAAATVHDFFNILSVALLLPIELMFSPIEKASVYLSSIMYGSVSGMKYSSPVKAAIKPVTKFIKTTVTDTFGLEGSISGIVLMIVSGIIIIFALSQIVRIMNVLIQSNKTDIINKMLSKNSFATIIFGALLTISVQSSSITTSLLIPMAGAGLLNLNVIYPITIGANIGTTATALLAAMTGNMAGLSIALVHLIFNIIGALVFYPNKRLRQLPINMAYKLAETLEKSKLIGLGYVGGIFFALPISMIFIFR